MNAAVLSSYGATDVIQHVKDRPVPVLEPDQVLIRVRACALAPLDTQVAPSCSGRSWRVAPPASYPSLRMGMYALAQFARTAVHGNRVAWDTVPGPARRVLRLHTAAVRARIPDLRCDRGGWSRCQRLQVRACRYNRQPHTHTRVIYHMPQRKLDAKDFCGHMLQNGCAHAQPPNASVPCSNRDGIA
jgi:hypothetical protein